MGLSIKDHIDQGHYPKDEKGRALVPATAGGHVVVCATDMPGTCPILGYRMHPSGEREPNQRADTGFGYYADTALLLPPPPRKVKVTRWAVLSRRGNKTGDPAWFVSTMDENKEPEEGDFHVELTGEYEEEWPS